jgi:hypothetical protein
MATASIDAVVDDAMGRCRVVGPPAWSARCDRSEPIVVIQLHPKNPDILYVTTNDYIYKSRDGGRTWTNISKGMSHSV